MSEPARDADRPTSPHAAASSSAEPRPRNERGPSHPAAAPSLNPAAPVGAHPAPTPTGPMPPAPTSELPSSGQPRVAPPPSAAAPPAPDAPAISVALVDGGARIEVESSALGDLALHVRVKDGVADVRAEGASAPLVGAETRALEQALAREGLSLGHVAVEPTHTTPRAEDATPSGNHAAGNDDQRFFHRDEQSEPNDAPESWRPDGTPAAMTSPRRGPDRPSNGPRRGIHIKA